MFEIGKKAYFVENVNLAIYGTITGLKKYGEHSYLVTLTTKTGEKFTGYESQFAFRKPAILNYWNK